MKTKKRLSKFPKLTLLMVIVFTLMFGGTASAFNDIKGDREQKAIERLEKLGIIKGDYHGRYYPAQKLTGAAAVPLIVKSLDLNFDTIRFIQMPKASDYYTKVSDKAWYAEAFIIANYYGLDIPKDINPAAKVTKEQFSHWLYKALSTKGDYAFTMQYLSINDEKQISKDYMSSIQALIKAKIVTLDKKGNFGPKQPVSRSEAAGMLDRTLQFIKDNQPIVVDPVPGNLYDFGLSTDKISSDVTKVTITAMAPHPGYGLEVSSITFKDDKALIDYRIVEPKPGQFYPQVISEVKAVTYIPTGYQPVLGAQSK
ncbi:MAG: S-layer homology domain-containing protein [Paenibacillus sp.]|uniref:S-layer homology domain-containing protein n=1 Tax=Paenibacillus sp. TaxID=58172 RepID=UPI002912DE33|nr:S-layer homology domain-containing protein [Paenibacillus sp.]MDU4695444.1 S-layer homology domain-containing protein [Paenibacillus sp.]